MSSQYLISSFFWLALILLGGVTLGVGYLTFLEWKEKRNKPKS